MYVYIYILIDWLISMNDRVYAQFMAMVKIDIKLPLHSVKLL